MPLTEIVDPFRGLLAPAGLIGEIAKIHQQGDRPIVVVGPLCRDPAGSECLKGHAGSQLVRERPW